MVLFIPYLFKTTIQLYRPVSARHMMYCNAIVTVICNIFMGLKCYLHHCIVLVLSSTVVSMEVENLFSEAMMPEKVMKKIYYSIDLDAFCISMTRNCFDAFCVSNFTVYLYDEELLHGTPKIVHTSLASGSILAWLQGITWKVYLLSEVKRVVS